MKRQTNDPTGSRPANFTAKRILALIGVILLLGLYASTLFCALFAKENVMRLLMASIYATVVIPVLIWACSFLYKLIHGNDDADTKRGD